MLRNSRPLGMKADGNPVFGMLSNGDVFAVLSPASRVSSLESVAADPTTEFGCGSRGNATGCMTNQIAAAPTTISIAMRKR